MNWYLKVVKDNYANFKGRATRKEYWMFVLFNLIIYYGLAIFEGLTGMFPYSEEPVLSFIYTLAVLIPAWAVAVRRMHDTGRSGWFILIPLYNFLVSITESDEGGNKYGPHPITGSNVETQQNDHSSEKNIAAPVSADATVVEPDATVVENTMEPITLTIETGPNAGSFYPINNDTKIGRANDNDIVLDVKTVSGYHCNINVEEGQFIIRDLDSTNGIKVNGRKVKKGIIKPGKVIELSTVKIVVS